MRERLIIWIVAGGTLILGLMALLIVGGVVYQAIFKGAVNTTLANWGGLIVGFFVGGFFNFVRAALEDNHA